MKQHNASATDNGRKCWNNARERDRMKSRYEIKKRVAEAAPLVPGETSSSSAFDVIDEKTNASDEVISKYLWYIRQGNRSKFSTTFMDCFYYLLRSPHPIRHILKDPVALTHTIQLLTSKHSPEDAMRIQQHMESLSKFTLIEYAVWLEKYSIVSAMLYGGINPCIRSCKHHNHDRHNPQQQQQQQQPQQQQQKLAEIGSIVLQRFFDTFPLRLSTYIVTSVVHMRRIDDLTAVTNNNNNNNSRCLSCQDMISIDFMLQFKNCNHVFCELCFWKDLLFNIDTPAKHAANDVISCIICGATAETTVTSNYSQNNTVLVENNDASVSSCCSSWKEYLDHLNPSEKRELSLQRYLLLPVNQHTLKARSSKKKKHSERDHISSNWQQAVLPSLGSTQDVRRDKFMIHVERNTIPYVKGCLLGGVDVNQTNEYGQSAVYVATWRGYSKLVEMLFEHGADPLIPTNGGSTIFSLCSIHQNTNVIESIDQYHSSSSKAMIEADTGTVLTRYFSKGEEDSTASLSASISNNTNLRCTSLISEFSDHIGAGSCFIDDVISSDTVDVLLQLFHSLPVDTNQKLKKNSAPCSDRSYFCDSEGSIRQLLGNAIIRAGLASTAASVEDITKMSVDNHPSLASQSTASSIKSVVRVFPHMRFLNYSISGTVLPPHIDLVRVNPFGDPLNPEHRSTHTFILYLTDCHLGGATNLLECVSADGSSDILAKVSPRRGRLLLFPHACPHEGMEVVDLPKILLRGEVQIGEISTD
jgi:hypothetical protein